MWMVDNHVISQHKAMGPTFCWGCLDVENGIRIITGIRYPDYPFRYPVTIIRQKISDNPDNTCVFFLPFSHVCWALFCVGNWSADLTGYFLILPHQENHSSSV